VATGRRGRSLAFQVPGDLRAELDRPTANGLAADLDPALGQEFFDVAETQGEAEIEPHRVADDLGREPMTLEGQGTHGVLLPASTNRVQPQAPGQGGVKLTAPWRAMLNETENYVFAMAL
jgi:hypothetical protein